MCYSLLVSISSFVKWRQLTYNIVSISCDHFVKQFGIFNIDSEQLWKLFVSSLIMFSFVSGKNVKLEEDQWSIGNENEEKGLIREIWCLLSKRVVCISEWQLTYRVGLWGSGNCGLNSFQMTCVWFISLNNQILSHLFYIRLISLLKLW